MDSAIPDSMQAIVLSRFGGPEVLELRTVPTPRPAAGELLIRVAFVSVNRVLDVHTRSGTYRRDDIRLPHVLGADPTGVVVALGTSVDPSWLGRRVAVLSRTACGTCPECRGRHSAECEAPELLGITRWGGYAEFASIPAQSAFPIPDDLPSADATVIARHVPTAYHLLRDLGEVQRGQWLLVTGAAGALGLSAIQVAKVLGARVIAAAGSPRRVALAMRYGADAGVSYDAQDLEAEVLRLTGSRGVSVVLENVGSPAVWPVAFRCLRRYGRLVAAGAHGGGTVPLELNRLYLRSLRILGDVSARPEQVTWALSQAATGRIRPVPYRVLPLADAVVAHRTIEADRYAEKMLLAPGSTTTRQGHGLGNHPKAYEGGRQRDRSQP
jgi:NADPH:quinone reductase-like Zn-dependent oxidoreductase